MFRYIEELLLFFLIIYVLKGVLRSFFSFVSKTNPTNNSPNNSGFSDNSRREQASKPEGKIEVDYIPPKKEKSKNDKRGGHFEGDFVDYEDIKK